MEAKNCKGYDSCSAPICPLAGDGGIWYADESICSLKEIFKADWVKNQHKIAKKTRDLDTYYTHRMLQHNCIIGKGISGLDPNHDLDDMGKDEDRWMRDHPEKPKISECEREKRRQNMKRVRQGNNPTEKDAIRIENSSENR